MVAGVLVIEKAVVTGVPAATVVVAAVAVMAVAVQMVVEER